jgi:hypothetical protein
MIAIFIFAPTSMPPTPEWIKILVTALLSFIAGIALDPLRNSIARRLTAKRAMKVLYFELARIYEVCGEARYIPAETIRLMFSRIVLEHYDYYYAQHREAFYLIPRHDSLSGLFGEIKLCVNDVVQAKSDPHQSARDILEAIEARIKGGVVDKIKFDYAMRTMQKSSQPVREALGENIRKAVAENRYSDK